jgi:hypothetical protein
MFPELAVRAPNQFYSTTKEIGTAICATDSALFCKGKLGDDVDTAEVVCKNIDKLSDDLKTKTSIPAFCKADPSRICSDPLLRKLACEEKSQGYEFDFGDACKVYPDKCKFGSSTFDRCAFDWVECLTDPDWDFCKSFPEMCTSTNTPTFLYKSPKELEEAVCAADPALFCKGEKEDVDAFATCDNIDKLPAIISMESGVKSFCAANPRKLCTEHPAKDYICPKGEITSEYCKHGLYPEKCKFGTSTFDRCALDWVECMLDPSWDYCKSFPEICGGAMPPVDPTYKLPSTHVPTIVKDYVTGMEMIEEICKEDSELFCDGKAMLNVHKVCGNVGKLPMNVQVNTSLKAFCAEASIEKICKMDAANVNMICPDGKTLAPSFCGQYPEKCDSASTKYDSCADDVYRCMINPSWNFCKSFPELCTKTMADSNDMITAICTADSNMFCRGGAIPSIKDVCTNFSKLPVAISAHTSFKSLCNTDVIAIC